MIFAGFASIRPCALLAVCGVLFGDNGLVSSLTCYRITQHCFLWPFTLFSVQLPRDRYTFYLVNTLNCQYTDGTLLTWLEATAKQCTFSVRDGLCSVLLLGMPLVVCLACFDIVFPHQCVFLACIGIDLRAVLWGIHRKLYWLM